jgi:hypothetical protein
MALVVPSPKLQAHTVGPPVEVSVNAATGPLVATENCAAMPEELAAVTVTLWLTAFEPAALLAVRVTVNVPVAE